MKALIFLAGTGKRLSSITKNPKCLLKINGKPIIKHYLDILLELGIKEVLLVVGYNKEKIIKLLGNEYKGIKIRYIYNKRYLKGSILSLLCAMEFFDDDVITMDGDLIFDKRILQKLINTKIKNCILVDFDKKNIKGGMKVVISKRGVVKDINYEIKRSKGDTVAESVGFIKWSGEDSLIFKEAFKFLIKCDSFDDVYEKAVRYLIYNNKCKFGVLSASKYPWMFINYPSDYIKAKELYIKWKLNR